jgi:hypothetical protein
MQRAVSMASGQAYRLCRVGDSKARYDCFFENIYVKEQLPYEDLTVDLYGRKQPKSKYLLTTEGLNYKVISSYGMAFRPIELNVLLEQPGNEIFLYDCSIPEQKKKQDTLALINYYWYPFQPLLSMRYILKLITQKIGRKRK